MMQALRDLNRDTQPFRMVGWAAMGIAFYGASIAVGNDYPQPQVALWKLGHVTMFSFVGYWISRRAIGRIKIVLDGRYTQAESMIIAASVLARALIIGMAILAANGL